MSSGFGGLTFIRIDKKKHDTKESFLMHIIMVECRRQDTRILEYISVFLEDYKNEINKFCT